MTRMLVSSPVCSLAQYMTSIFSIKVVLYLSNKTGDEVVVIMVAQVVLD